MRVDPKAWRQNLGALLDQETRIVGFSVMSGVSINDSLAMSAWVREQRPEVKIVWGGPHPTFSPDDIMEEPLIDYVISGYGRDAFFDLTQLLFERDDAPTLEQISGLGWRDKDGKVHLNPTSTQFEFLDYRTIPYHLIEDYSVYRHIDDEIVFPLYSVMGCPYKCAFCSTPAQLRDFRKKWVPYDTQEVVEHIRFLHQNYHASYIYFIDEDSFVNLHHVEGIIRGVKEADLKVKLGFRGARINEILKMTPEFLQLLVDAGTSSMHIGAECGSNRVLSLMEKQITVDDILKANRKLAAYPQMRIFYNFIVGYPTETLEETKQTRDMILQLMADNPHCYIIPLNKPRPLPKTKLYDLAVQHHYQPPRRLREWGDYDVESSDYNPEWLSKRHNRFIRMMFLCMYFIDNKIHRLNPRRTFSFMLLRLMAILYRPLAMSRFRRSFDALLFEDWAYRVLSRIMTAKS